MVIPRTGNELDRLAVVHGTDKSSKKHNYTDLYEKLFRKYKDDSFNLLEIGVKNGASLRMWSDYFPTANIYGIDIQKACASISGRFKVFTGNQYDVQFLKLVGEELAPMRIIVDDGGHVCSHQVISFLHLWPYLESGGYYVIEDLHTNNIPRYCDVGKVKDLFSSLCLPVVQKAGQLGGVMATNDLLIIWKR